MSADEVIAKRVIDRLTDRPLEVGDRVKLTEVCGKRAGSRGVVTRVYPEFILRYEVNTDQDNQLGGYLFDEIERDYDDV